MCIWTKHALIVLAVLKVLQDEHPLHECSDSKAQACVLLPLKAKTLQLAVRQLV